MHMSAKWFNFASGLPHEDKGEVAGLRDVRLLLCSDAVMVVVEEVYVESLKMECLGCCCCC